MFFDKGMQEGAAVVNDENLTNQEATLLRKKYQPQL
jgi:hypothetical protein